jgi:hypothetical protein
MKPEIQKALDNIALIIEKRARYESGEEFLQVVKDFRLIKAELEKESKTFSEKVMQDIREKNLEENDSTREN